MINVLYDSIVKFNPTDEFTDAIRNFNIFLAIIAIICLFFGLGLPNWQEWNVAQRLGFMAKVMFCLCISYGAFEILYLPTNFRVPMVSIALLFTIIAALWPEEKTSFFWSRKKRDEI